MPMKALIATLSLLACGSCWAALGTSPDLPAAGGTQQATAAGARYTHLRRQLESGTTVHEFVDAAGRVFAVAWSGPFLPDLRELLGEHFALLEQQEAAMRSRASAVSVQRPEVVIVSAGRMRAFQGRAWLPRQLPAGFDPAQLP